MARYYSFSWSSMCLSIGLLFPEDNLSKLSPSMVCASVICPPHNSGRELSFHIFIPRHTIVAGYYGFTLFVRESVRLSVHPLYVRLSEPASVAQLDAPSDWRPGGHGFNPPPPQGWQHSFVEIDHEIFSTVILSLPLIQEGQLSVSGERMCTILVNRLED